MDQKVIEADETQVYEEKRPPENQIAPEPNRKQPKNRRLIIVSAIAALVLVAAAIFYWLSSANEQVGKPVPAPRSSSFETAETTEQNFTGQTITLQPDQLKNADIKIETVGEQINAAEVGVLATGTVQANAYRETPVISLVGGVVRQIGVQAGEYVQNGQTIAVVFSNEFAEAQSNYLNLLAQLNESRLAYQRAEKLVRINQTGRTELEQARRDLQIAQAELDEHHRHHERTEKLLKIGASSREEFEQATTKLRTAEAQRLEARRRFERAEQLLEINPVARAEFEQATTKLRNAEAQLASSRQRLLLLGMPSARIAALRSANQISGEIAVPSPVSGTVTSRAVNLGEVVEANKELAKITNLSSVWVIAQVFEQDLARLRTGSGASVTTDAFPDRVFRGTVTYIDPRLDEATRTAQVRVEIENPNNLLKIGMYVRVAFGALGDAERTMAAVPAVAVQNVNNRQIVFVATAQPNVFELRAVRLGAESNGQYPVLEGLNVGERVVTDGSFMLRAEWVKTNQSQ
ncbi:MAG: efflux RND transporter periplasmic adaptor subunit [Acidobacteriota bacterium]|nr:efflux RND transporter periplasmic adaptor subunit [Acidobacteriota bacterium]